MEFIPTIAMGALVIAIINFLRYVRNGEWNGALTQLSAWIAGVVVLSLAAHTDFAAGIAVGDRLLSELNGWSVVFVGMTIASVGSFGVEIKKALDGSDSAAKPALVPPKAPDA